MRYLLILLTITGCASQPEIRTYTHTDSTGKVYTQQYVVPSTPGYKSNSSVNSSTTTYTDGRGTVIGYGFSSGGM